jgi:hypothetical protein
MSQTTTETTTVTDPVVSICSDCAYYAEYGRLDDTTMMEVEATAT